MRKRRQRERAATIVKVVTGTLPPVNEDDCTFEDDEEGVWIEPIRWIPEGGSDGCC